ncbi:MAG: amidohydrolase family protein [Spirochaetes bacterium]|nr:amidohydrolase family protein [Spirochaetota bacterium]
MKILITDVLTVTMDPSGTIDRLNLLIEDDRFKSVSKSGGASPNGDRTIDGTNLLALPGFVNGHIHCDVTLARGLGDGLTLYEQDHDSFVSQKGWFKDQLDGEARRLSRLLQYAEAVRGGTTFICDVPFWHYKDDLVSPFEEVGVRGAVVLDYRKNFLTGEPVEEKEYFKTAQTLRNAGILPVVELPAEEDFETPLLLRLYRRACDLDAPIQLHLAETVWRIELIRKRYGGSPVRYLNEIGVLSERIIGSHGVYLDDGDITMLKESGAKIVNCPAAEMKIADGTAPVAALMQKGVDVCIGTDGALWNDSADMFREMKVLMLLQRLAFGAGSMPPERVIRAATIGGARVFGMQKETGSIEEGKHADLVLVDLDRFHLVPHYHGARSNVLELITGCATAADVHTVIASGKIVVDRGRLTTIDEEALKKRCQDLACRRFRDLD